MAYRFLFLISSSFLTLFFVELQPRLQCEDFMQLKYQYLIDEYKLADACPGEDCAEIEITAYRWAHSPLTHAWNFLPNIEYDKAKKTPPRLLTGDMVCSRCGASFYTTEEKARKKLNDYKENLEAKHKQFVDNYTHIAKGDIKKTDGKATKIKREHFGFYEYETCDMKKTFELMAEPV